MASTKEEGYDYTPWVIILAFIFMMLVRWFA
ncbi:MAG: hypothetical protein RLZZ182_1848 [Pseudomonadota bacterium]|jgi:hypothetical protein